MLFPSHCLTSQMIWVGSLPLSSPLSGIPQWLRVTRLLGSETGAAFMHTLCQDPKPDLERCHWASLFLFPMWPHWISLLFTIDCAFNWPNECGWPGLLGLPGPRLWVRPLWKHTQMGIPHKDSWAFNLSYSLFLLTSELEFIRPTLVECLF